MHKCRVGQFECDTLDSQPDEERGDDENLSKIFEHDVGEESEPENPT